MALIEGLLFDEDDRERIEARNWWLTSYGYAACYVLPIVKRKRRILFMHQLILNASSGQEIDHRNGNRIDNRKENLRFVTRPQNGANRHQNKLNTSGYRGVSWVPRRRKWRAAVKVHGKLYFLGHFNDIIFAAAVASTWRTLYMEGARF